MENKKEPKKWLTTKSIRFDSKKLNLAKKKGKIKDLPKLCRDALDQLIKD